MDFATTFQVWLGAITQPGEAFFQEQKGKSNLNTAMIWLAITTVIVAFFNTISSIITHFIGGSMMPTIIQSLDLPPQTKADLMAQYGASGLVSSVIGSFCGALFFIPIGFFIGMAILFVLAKLFGGEGNFETHTYLLATIFMPLSIITSAIGIVPVLGGCLALVISIYQLVLNYFAIKVAHNLSSGSAIAVVLIPIVVILGCIICFGFAFAGIIIAALAGSSGG